MGFLWNGKTFDTLFINTHARSTRSLPAANARLSKSLIPDPLFLSPKNGHKNHLRKFWSEKCPFFAFCGKVWFSNRYKNLARIFVWFLKIRATFPRFFVSKTRKFLWGISEFLCWIPELLWVIRKFLYWIFQESKSAQIILKSALYFEENPVSKLFTFSSKSFALGRMILLI